MIPIEIEIEKFLRSVRNPAKVFNRMSGRLLHHLIAEAGVLDGPHAEALLRSAEFAGTGNRTLDVNQAACEYLLQSAGIGVQAVEPELEQGEID